MSDQRRARILDAALHEMARRGFEAASTNAIAAAADVAKGLPFHYFGSKEALFLAVYEHVAERVLVLVDGAPLPADLFERLHELGLRKMRVFRDDPVAYRFVTTAVAEAPPGVRAAVERLQAKLVARMLPPLLEGIDRSRLRPGVTLAQALETITALGEGLARRVEPRLLAGEPLEALADELWPYYLRLRDGLYAPTRSSAGRPARARSGSARRTR